MRNQRRKTQKGTLLKAWTLPDPLPGRMFTHTQHEASKGGTSSLAQFFFFLGTIGRLGRRKFIRGSSLTYLNFHFFMVFIECNDPLHYNKCAFFKCSPHSSGEQ